MSTEQTKPIKLTKRMREILILLDDGAGTNQIAERLDISKHTVKVHLWRLFLRLGVDNRAQAVKWWHEHEPKSITYALRSAFDAACRLVDRLKEDGAQFDISEFEHHRAVVKQLEGVRT